MSDTYSVGRPGDDRPALRPRPTERPTGRPTDK